MKSRLVPILCLVAFAGVAFFLLGPWQKEKERIDQEHESASKNGGGPGAVPESEKRTGSDVVKRTGKPPAEPVILENMVALAEQLNDPDASVEDDLAVLRELVRAYTRFVGTGPEGGLNEEIVQCFLGANRMKLIFFEKGHAKLNERGELLDRFGSPYYFHPVSSELIEIRSAGPDRLLWTKDDVEVQ